MKHHNGFSVCFGRGLKRRPYPFIIAALLLLFVNPRVSAQALDLRQGPLEDREDLRLCPGLVIDCRLFYEGPVPAREEIILKKDREYLLRVSGHEDGKITFFVYLDGWEPRVRGPVPQPGKWYHIRASWTGDEVWLEVNGERNASPRLGHAHPSKLPLSSGPFSGLVTNLSIQNPSLAVANRLAQFTRTEFGANPMAQDHFDNIWGWPAWGFLDGSHVVSNRAGNLSQGFDGSYLGFSASLQVDLMKKRYMNITVEGACPSLTAIFVSSQGVRVDPFPLWGKGRTTSVDLSQFLPKDSILRGLGLMFPQMAGRPLSVSNLWFSEVDESRPFVFARSVSPQRAILRPGRDETLVGVFKNMGPAASNVTVRLNLPRDMKMVGSAVEAIPEMGPLQIETLMWKFRCEKSGEFDIGLEVLTPGGAPEVSSHKIRISPNHGLGEGPIPTPVPALSKTLNLVHYCALWKAGTHEGWGKIEPWPERRPALGWYDEGSPEVADWHVKYALEHGIQGFIYCWYRKGQGPQIQQTLGHALDAGLLKSRFVSQFKFALMWENLGAEGVKDRDDLLNNLLPYWMTNYFKHPSYVKIDNKPVLFVYIPGKLSRELGGTPDLVKSAFETMRQECRRHGFSGLSLVGCVPTVDERGLRRMALEGWDASSAYGTYGASVAPTLRDHEGLSVKDYRSSLEGQEKIWRAKKEIGALPDIINVTMGWDPRPWFGAKTAWYLGPPDVGAFQTLCLRAKAMLEATPASGLDKQMVVFNSWNEFGEGHYLEPTAGLGFEFLEAIKGVFSPNSPPASNLIPEDLGHPIPETVYLKSKKAEIALEASPDAPFGVSWIPGNIRMTRLTTNTLRVPGSWAPFGDIPDFLKGSAYLCQARGNPKEPAPPFRFHASRRVRVYLFVHNRGTPAIPGGWAPTGRKATWASFVDTIYQKDFPPGPVDVPGHNGEENGSFGVPHGCVVVVQGEGTK